MSPKAFVADVITTRMGAVPRTVHSNCSNPSKEKIRTLFGGACMENLPEASVTVPSPVPFSCIDTPAMGFWSEPESTCPVNRWARKAKERSRKTQQEYTRRSISNRFGKL
jgi:hypothetical protein